MKRLVSKLWILVVSILFFCLFQTNLLSETPDNIFDVFSKINPKQPISIGEEIYRMGEMGMDFKKLGGTDYYSKWLNDTTKYMYVGFENNSIKILCEKKYECKITDTKARRFGLEPKPEEKVETKDLSIPINAKKQALLKVKDGKELVITIVDEFSRITVKELVKDKGE